MLGLQIFDTSSRAVMLWDFTPKARDLSLTTNEHGFAALTCFVPMTLSESFQVYDRPGLPHVIVTSNGYTVWEGRLEDVSIVNGGVRLTAFGYQRAMSDVPYTALWSTSGYADWFIMDDRMVAATNSDQFSFDNNNRLYITPENGSTQGSVTPAKVGRWGYAISPTGERNILAVSFDYQFKAPTNWRGILQSWGSVYYPIGGSVWGSNTTEWTVNGSGTLQTGGTAFNIAGTAMGLNFRLDYNAADATYGSANGTDYLKITNLRLKTTTAGSVLADEIVNALTVYVNGINSTQIDTSTVLVESPGAVDLVNENYEDTYPSDILNHLIEMGDDQTPPRQWEWGVWEDRRLHFRPRGSAAMAWYVDATLLEVERSLEGLINSTYAIYRDENGNIMRTGVLDDSDSIARYGITRRAPVNVDTTSWSLAINYREAALDDSKDIKPRSQLAFGELYDSAGARVPLYMCRSGDTITIRNLPPSISAEVDRIRTFIVAETEYRVNDDILLVVPESPIPSLQSISAQREAKRVR